MVPMFVLPNRNRRVLWSSFPGEHQFNDAVPVCQRCIATIDRTSTCGKSSLKNALSDFPTMPYPARFVQKTRESHGASNHVAFDFGISCHVPMP